ncbi:Dockerin type I repeat protein [Rubripirellula tenax]|uniref:Dockerin type I repeat protein n=1 Tax=Rubripirellula tenax TaxID=2528015 RepID=A0A5C6EEM9_9BACT|nr:tandem-95 repeat protein [Rubripirellula tenax]TWU47288.1 Dockerin type I repeat protein [Rubripirellula tenax]
MTKRRTLRRRSTSNTSSRSLHHETLEKRELLAAEFGPRLISVATNSGTQFDLAGNNPLFEAPREVTFRFDGGQEINPATLSAFKFTASGGDGGFTEGNEVDVTPGFIGLGDSSRIVIARFASDLPDDQYRISISGYDDTANGLVALRNIDGDLFQPTSTINPATPSQDILMNIEVGPRVVAVVPQPIDYTTTPRTQLRNTIHVYFNNDALVNPSTPVVTSTGSPSDPTVVRPAFYNLFFTDDTVETGDDVVHNPTSVTFEAALNRATLTFSADLSTLTTSGDGTFRLRVGSSQALPTSLAPDTSDITTDVGDTFSAARDLGISFGSAGDASVTIGGVIEAPVGNTVQWPGIDSPGVRDDRRDAQVVGRADTTDGVDVFFYNFANLYGTDASQLPLENAITPAQQQRTREILDLYSQSLGVQFIETEDQGLQIVTGDLRALVETASTGPGLPFQEFRVNDEDPSRGVLILDAGENWYDGYGLSPDARPSWFVEALRGVGSLLGIGNTFEQVPGVASGSLPGLYDPTLFPVTTAANGFSIEPDFLSTSDIIPGQALHRPEIRDADLYKFTVEKTGRISIESFAQRLQDTSLLDTDLQLWKLNATTGKYDLVARNADFYGNDSFIGIDVAPNSGGAAATYVLGVTAAGNEDYNPNIEGSGGGGRSQGRYDMRISFVSSQVNTIVDTNESRLDGDSDGQQGGDFNFWFRVTKTKDLAAVGEPRTLFVSPTVGTNTTARGTVDAPLQTIAYALSQSRPGDIVRLLPDGGTDGRIDTTADNRAYEIGRASNGSILADGETLRVPKGVTVMVDAGSILKLRSAKISVGSESVDEDRSLAAFQVLGAPFLVDRDGAIIDGTVDITSYREESRDGVLLGADTNLLTTTPTPGDWAGIEFRHDFDYSEGRKVWENEGIFLDYVSHADIRYGGGSVQLTDPVVTPLQMLEARPTLVYNSISQSRDAAMSADPNSFAETNFAAPVFQQASLDRFGTTFTSDYDRVGPFIRGNVLSNNSINGLFVRVVTPAAGQREPMTVAGRFDDADIVHTLSEVLVLQGEPGGPVLLEERPDVVSSTIVPAAGTGVGTLVDGTTLDYRITFVNQNGFESLASLPTRSVDVTTSGAVVLGSLPTAPAEYSGRRLYRQTPSGDYELVTTLDRVSTTYTDTGVTRGGLLSSAAIAATNDIRLLPRTNARLSVDPGLVVKLESARIEVTFGADFYAEGVDGKPVVFTSRTDDRYGAGGTFDTTNDGDSISPTPGDWSGLVFRQGSSASIDYATISYGGGDSATSGELSSFNPIEILQADVRVAHSTFANNASGDNDGYGIRDGIGFNSAATIFVRGAQPILVDNTIIDNDGAAISINPDALNYLSVRDRGRGTGAVDVFVTDGDNQGPLIAANKLDNNTVNGLFIRNESLTTESVWDDADIVHVVEESVYVYNHHQRSGLRLKSDPNQSLVVKFQAGGSINAEHVNTDVTDSIGGTVQVLGQPGFPVVMTSASDCSVGAGFTPDGVAQTDTLNENTCVSGDVIFGPMIDQFTDSGPNIDEWSIVADDSGSISVTVYDSDQGIISLNGGTPVTLNNETRTITINNVAPGSVHVFTHELIGTLTHYRPVFSGASQVFFVENRTSPNDVFNSASGTGTETGSNLELGFDERFDTLPSKFADTTYFYDLDVGDQITWRGFFDDFPGGADAVQVDLIAPDGTIVQSVNTQPILPNAGTTLNATVGANQAGFWGVKLTAPESIEPFAGHYLMDVEVTGAGGARDVQKSVRHYLLKDSFLASPFGLAAAGDWYGIIIQPGANDRNVAFIGEAERSVSTLSAVNAIPTNAQILGSLAQDEKSSDENRRLGFNVRGSLSQNGDIDVYSFKASGGTEVFIDIDDTDFGLDTVVELIDINGNILALSNSSITESVTPTSLVNNIGPGRVLPLRKTGIDIVETPNAMDAGMRVVLPGNSANPDNVYYVRVRSSNLRPGDFASRLTTSSLVGAGLSSGQYQLSIRLRETDEIAGSTIRLADIRFAFNAIDIPAAPSHSPLAGEHAEELNENGIDVNDGGTAFNGTEGSAQFANANGDPLGALSFSDRGTLRVSGTLGNQVLQSDPQFGLLSEQDIDVYRVDLFSNVQEPNIIGENRFVSTTFDIDYADQLGRPNTSIAVYSSAGRLILHSRDSNIADDQGRPTDGNDMTNLSAGSGGTLDAYIGPVELQVGTYYVVVSSAQMIPSSLDQMFENNPVDSNVRILPIDSSRRLVEENFFDSSLGVNSSSNVFFNGQETVSLKTAAELPSLAPVFDETSLVPYKLEDVRLFVTLDQGLTGTNQSTLVTIDPFTGRLERTIGQFGQPVGDLAMRRDGELFSYSLGPQTGNQTNGNSGNFLNISSANAAANNSGDDGLTFRRNNQAGTGTEGDDNAQLLINAMAFVPSTNTSAVPGNNPNIPDGERAFALGDRDNFGRGEIPDALRRNILYSVVANSGAATNQGSTNAMLDRNFPNAPFSDALGAASNKRELGIVDTGQFIDSPTDPDGNLVNGGSITGIAIDPVQGTSLLYAVSDQGYVYTFNPFDQRSVDVDGDPNNQYTEVINSTNHGLVTPDPDDFTSTFNGFVRFSSLTMGPRITERADTFGLGPFAQVMFGITAEGWIYTMQIDPVTNRVAPAHVLMDGRASIPMADAFGNTLGVAPTGAAFSIREENLWHQTTDRGTDDGHGLFVAPDQSRIRTLGGSSLYFGVEIDGNADNNTIEGGNGTLNPGGAHGSVVSRPISLDGYSSGDKPTLYFNYFLETENDPDYDPPSNGINNQQVDAFRVFAAGDDGQWRLLTTNDTYRSFSNVPSDDEYDLFALNGGIPIQETFENTGDWRQARVDLSPLAGHKNVQLRFDFSTAGGMQSQFFDNGYLTEIQATPGTDIVEGSGFGLFSNTTFDFANFEFVRGAAVNVPDPTTIVDGQLVSFTGPDGNTTTLRLTTGPELAATDLNIAPTDLAADLATKIATRLQTLAPTLLAVANGNQVIASEAQTFLLEPAGFGSATAIQNLPNGNVPVFYASTMTMQQVRDSIRQSLANGIGNVDVTTGITTATLQNYPEYGTNRIRVYNQNFFSNTSALGFSTFLPGDEFGAAASTSVSNTQINTRPGSNNNVEGVYIDDIVVGFAERGEVVYNAPVNRNFSVLPEQRTFTFTDEQVPEFPNEILVGGYTLEVRKSSDYGVPEDYDPIRLQLNEQFGLGRSFDTNDRLTDGVTLIVPSAETVVDGDTFVLSNGTASLTFEFDSNNNVTAGRIPVPFTPIGVGTAFSPDTDESDVLARNVRDAINSTAARNVLGIRAGGGDSSDLGALTGNRVELFGSSIQVNPSAGRFIKVDMVNEETFYGRESARTIPSVDHDAQTAVNSIFYDTFARATVTDYVNGNTDTLVAVGKIGDHVGTGDGNELILDVPSNDVDIVKIYLRAGDAIDVDLDTIGWTRGTVLVDPLLEIYADVAGIPTLVPTATSLRAPGETTDGLSILGFTAPASGYYYVRVAAEPGFFFGTDSFGDYQLTIRPNGFLSKDILMVDYHFGFGDANTFRDQGQLIIESNFIRNFTNTGIRATFDPGEPSVDDDANFTSTPLDRRPGSATLLRNENSDRLLPGTVITNNVVITDSGTGIEFSGEVAGSGDSPVPTPFGRIVNNTVVGNGSGTGISVSGGASPTVLNNIIANFGVGVDVAGNSLSTEVNGNALQGNGTNATVTLSATNFIIPVGTPLFQNADAGIYIPAEGSVVIDSSFASLNDRSNFDNTVKQPVGISSSPIIAPSFDAYGIPRVDDPNVATPGGVGANVFIDRGAIDRSDVVRPIATLVSPLDFNSAAGGQVDGGDIDPSESFVRLTEGSVEFFEIQLTDPSGSGPDGRTITSQTVLLTENGRRLVPGVDYTFGYSDNSRLIRLTPLAGLWRTDAVYEITLNNQTRIAYQAPAGDEITDGDQVTLTDNAGNRVTFEYESGYAVAVPQTTLLTIEGANNAFADRETFVVTAPNGNSITFEFNLVGSTTGGRVPIELSSASTLTQVRNAILASFASPAPGAAGQTVQQFLDLAPVAVGNDAIQLGTLVGHAVTSASPGLTVSGQTGGVVDGQTFVYTTAAAMVTFEFDSDGSTAAGNVAIPMTRQSTPSEVAQAIVTAVRGQGLGLGGAVATEDGTVVLGGQTGDLVDTTASALTLQGAPGVASKLSLTIPPASTGASIDGDTFTVTHEGATTTFRYTTDPNFVSADRLVLLAPTDLINTIATKSAVAIAAAFPGDLLATAAGATILIGEPSAATSSTTTSVTGGSAGLIPGGISGGAIAVNYLPTSPRNSIAATLQSAIAASPLNVSTFEAGGGTILISGGASLLGSIAGGPETNVGVLTPAITDLAGNPVSETRTNDETRFTIIMPDVVFDFGDAPTSYGTLVSDNGARHTIGTNGLPRLGDFIDSEDNGQPIGQDDAPISISISTAAPGGQPVIFTIDPLSIPQTVLATIDSMPIGGETLAINVGGRVQTFELVELNSNPTDLNIPVTFTDSESLSEIMTRLVTIIRGAIPQTDDGLLIAKNSDNSLTITSTDDEDGVLQGEFIADGTTYNVFTQRGTDPTNVQTQDVLGFLNPKDPAGTNVDVKVFGAGLLHAWIDFDQSGVFDADEQVVANLPVSGDPLVGSFNTLTVFTPSDAIVGNTWMRVRISESGNLLPTGVAIGGEVEDYSVQVISVDLPMPDDDTYSIDEDALLDTHAQMLPSISDGDVLPLNRFLPPQYIVGSLPTNGTLVSLDSNTGHFVYQPNPDFNGVDTFTYRLSTQPNENATTISLDSFATVTINVAPVNDAPGGSDQDFLALEDLPLTITADQLLVDAVGDATVVPPATGGVADPFLSEQNQVSSLRVVAVQGSGGTPITASNTASAAGNIAISSNGSGVNVRVNNAVDGDIFSLAFAGTSATFELVPVGGTATAGAVAVAIATGDTPATIASRLATQIGLAFAASGPAVSAAASGDTVSVSFTGQVVQTTPSNASVISVTPIAGGQAIDVLSVPTGTTGGTTPVTGDRLTINIAGQSRTYEFVAAGSAVTAGNIAVPLLAFADPSSAAARASAAANLAEAINDQFLSDDTGTLATIVDGTTNPNQLVLSYGVISAAKPFATSRGSAIALFDANGSLIELRYLSGQDLNRDNPPPATPALTDEFTYVIRDNGVSIDLTNNRFDYGTQADSLPATATIDVAPQNDPPELVADIISVGPLGPNAANVLTDWETFGGETPTEDQPLTIDPAFLLRNDSRGPTSAADESAPGSLNDTGLSVTSVAMLDGAQGTVELIGGQIIFTPATNIFGDVIFTYSAQDEGINESSTGTRALVPLTSVNGTVTVSVQPVNDAPVAFDRALSFTESSDPGTGPALTFTRDQLILGSAGETPATPGVFAPTLAAPFNESEQTAGLRVVAFTTTAGTVDAASLTGTGTETLTLASDNGGTFEFDFVDGIFTVGRLTTTADYNARTPFNATDTFSYVIADDGLTTDPQSNAQFNLPAERSDANPAVVTITVNQANDAPTFTLSSSSINILERDDSVGTTVPGFALNVLPGPASATDEINRQTVEFTFPASLNGPTTVPVGLFTRLPELTPDGILTVFPAPDAIGSATFVVQASDVETGTTGFVSRQALATFTVNVRPVNDAPRFSDTLDPRSDVRDADDAYTVAAGDSNGDGQIDDATIRYTLREDNTQANGVVEDYFIPLRRENLVGYSRVGLLDVFNVGPANEAGAFEGGSQLLEFLSAGTASSAGGLLRTTDRGGTLTPVFDNAGVLTGLNYRPPTDFNSSFAGVDSFTYLVRDDNPAGGETFDLAAAGLVPDRLTASNRVELFLTPVNDRPEFDAATLNISVQEDTQLIRFDNYAVNISAGPATTAFDEVDVNTGQVVEFTVTSLDFPLEESADFFSDYPTIDEQTGLLTFRSAPNVFGVFRFEVVLSDQNRDGTLSNNTTRGDLISSIPVTMTINVNPVNDPPIVDPNAAPLSFSILEDGLFEILVEGDNTSRGLLDVYFPGPNVGATNESANIAPRPGGNQSVSLGSPVPTQSAQGGSLQLVTTNGVTSLLYRPRANFVGTDSFIYTVVDDGVTVDSTGVVQNDPRIASNTVTFEVLPVNDAPQFSGAGNVVSDEDQGPITFANWATNVLAGPATATDETDGFRGTPAQGLQFVFTQTSPNLDLFETAPRAVFNETTGSWDLQYQTQPDANGIAFFEVVLQDNGPSDPGIGDVFLSSPPRTFSINVNAVNDPPTFSLVNGTITRPEDSGPFSTLQVSNISPGPGDESAQTVSFQIEPLSPEFAALFTEVPSINADGQLRFTPAPNANSVNLGPIPIRVTGRDSAGAEAATVQFNIVITEVNDAPRAVSDVFSGDEDTAFTITTAELLANDVDPDLLTNPSETVQLVLPANSLSVSGAKVTYNSTTGVITYDPTDATTLQSLPAGGSLVDSFAYSLVDAAGLNSNLVTVAINVTGINDAPTLVADSPTLNPDGPTIIRVLDNDNDIDGTIDVNSLQITLQPAFGSLAIQPDGSLIYTPFSSFGEEDIFQYTVADNLGLRSDVSTVTISSNASPIARDDVGGTFLGEATIINVTANDSDPDGTVDLASVTIVTQARRGEAVPLADGTIQYLPAPGFVGRDTFTYQVRDNDGRPSNIATVSVQVVASRLQNPDEFSDVNDDGFVTAIDALLIINRLSRDSDGDGRVPVTESDRGPNYFDVSGDQTITSLDALRVINHLSRINNRVGAELVSDVVTQSVVGIDVLKSNADPASEAFDQSIADEFTEWSSSAEAKIVDVSTVDSSFADDVIDLIADGHQPSDGNDALSALDAAFIDLM